MGHGMLSPLDMSALRKRCKLKPPQTAIYLYATNDKVNAYNKKKMDELQTEEFLVKRSTYFYLSDKGQQNEAAATARLNAAIEEIIVNNSIPETTSIKAGAKIVLNRNISVERGFVNGATFVLVAANKRFLTVVKPENEALMDNPDLWIKIPRARWTEEVINSGTAVVEMHSFSPCWAATIHKVQGLTLRGPVFVDLHRVSMPGSAYTAISRLTSIEDLYLSSVGEENFQCLPEVKEFMTIVAGARESRRAREEKDMTDPAHLAMVRVEEEALQGLIADGGWEDWDGEEEKEDGETLTKRGEEAGEGASVLDSAADQHSVLTAESEAVRAARDLMALAGSRRGEKRKQVDDSDGEAEVIELYE